MQSEELIMALAADTRPVAPRQAERRIALGLVTGALATLVVMLVFSGLRPDIADAMHGFSFWMKWAYTASLAAIAIGGVIHVARPDAPRMPWLWLAILPVLAVASLAARELMLTPEAQWMPMWLGHSWQQCSLTMLGLSLPVFGGLIWSFRKLAPTNLRQAGAVAGLAAGAVGGTVYGLHCPEVSATFVITWYTLGMAAAAGLGALLGPRLLRW